MESYTLFQLNQFIRRFVALNLPDAVWVSAELTEAGEKRGHYYLSLIEKDEATDQVVAQGQAMLWSTQAQRWQRTHRNMRLQDILQPGRKVKLQVQAEYHERYGMKFMVLDIDPTYTIGQLAIQRQQTIAFLDEHGLLYTNSSLPLALAPQRLAIISSPTAAGLQDFLEHLRDNPYGYSFQIQLFQAAMQGQQASPEIRRQLRTIERRKDDFDAIVIIRGGGSRTDLADFDDKELCTAAAQASLPILTGIGHDTDQSVLDMVAHTALKTPTAVADFLVEALMKLEQEALFLGQQIARTAAEKIQQGYLYLDDAQQQIRSLGQQKLQRQQWLLEQYEQQIPLSVGRRLERAQWQLEQFAHRHDLLRLETSLARGFSVFTQADTIIASKDAVDEEQAAVIYFYDGTRTIQIK